VPQHQQKKQRAKPGAVLPCGFMCIFINWNYIQRGLRPEIYVDCFSKKGEMLPRRSVHQKPQNAKAQVLKEIR
jgi:hypothetical protein